MEYKWIGYISISITVLRWFCIGSACTTDRNRCTEKKKTNSDHQFIRYARGKTNQRQPKTYERHNRKLKWLIVVETFFVSCSNNYSVFTDRSNYCVYKCYRRDGNWLWRNLDSGCSLRLNERFATEALSWILKEMTMSLWLRAIFHDIPLIVSHQPQPHFQFQLLFSRLHPCCMQMLVRNESFCGFASGKTKMETN